MLVNLTQQKVTVKNYVLYSPRAVVKFISVLTITVRQPSEKLTVSVTPTTHDNTLVANSIVHQSSFFSVRCKVSGNRE